MKNCKIVSCGKKTAVMALAVSVGAMLMTGCSTSASASGSTASAGKPVVTVWAGGSDNVRVQFEKQIQQFNASQDQYTAELQFITSGTGAQGLFERVVAAKKAGQTDTDYDVIELGGNEVTKYVDEGGEDFFVPLDKSKIPNIDTLQVESTFRNDLVMPYRGTTAWSWPIIRKRWKIRLRQRRSFTSGSSDHPGRFAYNTPSSGGAGGSFVTTSIYNFMDESALTSSDPANKEQWGQGFELLKELHPYMYKSSGKVVYPNKNQGTLDLLANKEVDMIPAWADMAITQMKQGTLPESIKITQIDPSFTGSPVVLGIPSIGSDQDGAYAFLNYMLTPEAQNIALDSMAAIPVIDFGLLDQELTKTIEDLKIEEFRIGSLGNLGTELYEEWDSQIGTLE